MKLNPTRTNKLKSDPVSTISHLFSGKKSLVLLCLWDDLKNHDPNESGRLTISEISKRTKLTQPYVSLIVKLYEKHSLLYSKDLGKQKKIRLSIKALELIDLLKKITRS